MAKKNTNNNKKSSNVKTSNSDVKINKEIKKEENISNKNTVKTLKVKSNVLITTLSFIMLFSSIFYFSANLFNMESLGDVISSLLLLIFSVFFVMTSLTNPSKKKGTNAIALVMITIYLIFGTVLGLDLIKLPGVNRMEDLTNRSMSDAIEFATDKNLALIQEYEYSDMIDSYHIISQSIRPGKKLKGIKKLTVAISEGPSPYKEIVLPNMTGWDTEKVLEFIKKNHLTNVVVSFVQSDLGENILIEQNKSGNVKRNDEIKLTFSFGENREYSEVRLSDLTNKSKFEAEFYLKQYNIKYEFDYDFSDKIKRGNVISQSIEPGKNVTITGDNIPTLKVVISKGPKIIVPDLKSMNVSDITDWIIKNKLRLEFKDAYDEAVKENNVISASHNKDDIVEEETVITITISKGKLKMQKFKNLSEFRDWANKYGIKYEEQHEFSDSTPAGEVVKYSYETGTTIKNNDVIIVTISDGKRREVPNVKGLSKSDATRKLENAGLNVSFVYKYSNSVEKGKVINQSISAGSSVSEGTTITVTISNGKAPSGGSGSNTKPPIPSCDKSKGSELNIQAGSTGSQTQSMIKQLNPNHKFNWNMVNACPNGDSTPGTVCNNLEGVWKNYCDSITVTIVK